MSEALARRAAPPALRFGSMFGRLVLAGVIAGTLAGVYSLLVTERAMAPALVIEESRSAAGSESDPHVAELFARDTQLLGGFLGTVAAAVVFAVLLATVYGALRHRLPGSSDFSRLSMLAAVGFGVVALLPALKIPANPPAVGDPATVSTRTAIYAAVLLSGLVAAMLIAALVSFLRTRGVDLPTTATAATAVTGLLVAVILILLPDSPDAIPGDVPAEVVWDFRIASLGQLLILWSTLGLVGGWLVDRLARRPSR